MRGWVCLGELLYIYIGCLLVWLYVCSAALFLHEQLFVYGIIILSLLNRLFFTYFLFWHYIGHLLYIQFFNFPHLFALLLPLLIVLSIKLYFYILFPTIYQNYTKLILLHHILLLLILRCDYFIIPIFNFTTTQLLTANLLNLPDWPFLHHIASITTGVVGHRLEQYKITPTHSKDATIFGDQYMFQYFPTRTSQLLKYWPVHSFNPLQFRRMQLREWGNDWEQDLFP